MYMHLMRAPVPAPSDRLSARVAGWPPGVVVVVVVCVYDVCT